MRRTSARDVMAAVIAGATIGYLTQSLLASLGQRTLVPPLTFSVTLLLAAIAVLALAWPIRTALRGHARRRINPLTAARTAVLAKASSVSGALMTGLSLGLAFFPLTRPVAPGAGVIALAIAAVGTAALLLAAGLVAERWCTLPPDEPESEATHG